MLSAPVMTAAASVAAYGSRFLKRTMKRYGQAKAIVTDRLTGPFGEVVGRAYNEHSKNFLSPLMHINAISDQGVVTYELSTSESWRKPSKSHCLASCLRAPWQSLVPRSQEIMQVSQ